MKKLIVLCIAVISVFVLAACSESPTLTVYNGKSFKFSELQGKWVVINYWASWCKPCYKEIPALNVFYNDYKKKDVIVFGVSYDQVGLDELNNVIKKIGAKFPTLAEDPAPLLGLGNIPGLPATYVFNPKGKLVKTLLGLQTEASLVKAIGKS